MLAFVPPFFLFFIFLTYVFFWVGGFGVDLKADAASRKGWRRIIGLAIKSCKFYKRKSNRFGRLIFGGFSFFFLWVSKIRVSAIYVYIYIYILFFLKKKRFFWWRGLGVDFEADPASHKGWRRIIGLATKFCKFYKRKSN